VEGTAADGSEGEREAGNTERQAQREERRALRRAGEEKRRGRERKGENERGGEKGAGLPLYACRLLQQRTKRRAERTCASLALLSAARAWAKHSPAPARGRARE